MRVKTRAGRTKSGERRAMRIRSVVSAGGAGVLEYSKHYFLSLFLFLFSLLLLLLIRGLLFEHLLLFFFYLWVSYLDVLTGS